MDLFRGVDFGDARIDMDIPFDAPDRHRLTMTVYRPPREGRFPTVVQIYGAAWQRGDPNDNPAFGRYLAARGYVVFAIEALSPVSV